MFLYFPVTITGAVGIFCCLLAPKIYFMCTYDVTGGKVSHTFIILNWNTLYVQLHLETFYNYYAKDEKQNGICKFSLITAIIQINYIHFLAQFECLFIICRPLEVFCFYKQSILNISALIYNLN